MPEQDIVQNHESSDRENPEEIIDDITTTLEALQMDLSEGATIIGEEKERFEAIRPAWVELSSRVTTDPDVAQIYASGVDALAAFRDELKEYRPLVSGLTSRLIYGFSSSSDFTISTTSATVSMFSAGGLNLPDKVTLPRFGKFEETRSRLAKMDSSLADTYAAVREVLYGTHSDPERGALYLTRQLFDHFFGVLSPNDEVKSSDIWRRKSGEDDTKDVTRLDRIYYAADIHVQDQAKQKTLLTSAKHMLEVYNALNKAHKRGIVNQQQARQALNEMFTLIDSWVWAIDIG